VDFAVPDRLGDLGSFEAHYAAPIAQGAVTNATASTAATAFQRAGALRVALQPYLLRRRKRQVA